MNVRKSIEQALREAKESTGKDFEVERIVLKFEPDRGGHETVSLMELQLQPAIVNEC